MLQSQRKNFLSATSHKLDASGLVLGHFRLIKRGKCSFLFRKMKEALKVAKRTFRSKSEGLALRVVCVMRIGVSPIAVQVIGIPHPSLEAV